MRRGLVASVVLAGALVVTLTPTDGSQAQWRESVTRSVSGPASDGLGMTATDVPDTGATPWPEGRMATSPGMSVTSGSTRQTGWLDVRSVRVDKVVPGDANTVLSQTALDLTFGTGTCSAGGQATYWQARATGQLVDGVTYQRPSQKVAGATIPPGATRTLCPKVTLSHPSTVAGQRQALLDHAGRALDITTVLRQRAEAPATWTSTERTVTSRYRLAAPPPVKPAGWDVCRTTDSSGNPDGLLRYYGGFFWGWPDAPTQTSTPTPAMAGGWEILRRTRAGGWEVWKSVASGSVRNLAGINSRDISDERDEVREFKLRGYPFAGDRTRYVESAWIARAHNDWSLLTDRWACDSPLPNPDAGPHNLP